MREAKSLERAWFRRTVKSWTPTGGHMNEAREEAFVPVLETNSLTDIALIKATLEGEDISYFLKGENMTVIRQLDPVQLMVGRDDVERVVNLLEPLKLSYNRISL
jgi:hypothetical protein